MKIKEIIGRILFSSGFVIIVGNLIYMCMLSHGVATLLCLALVLMLIGYLLPEVL